MEKSAGDRGRWIYRQTSEGKNRLMRSANAKKTNSMKQRNAGNAVFWILLLCFAAIVFYSFVTTPYTGDIQVFMAGANQVKFQNSDGLMAVFEAWELKGIVNRLLIYTVYRITCLLVNYGNVYAFEIVSKLIYGVIALALLLVSSAILPVEKKDKIRFFFISFFAVFAVFTSSAMQAEMSVVLMGILVLALLSGESRIRMILGGAIGALFLFAKSILVLVFFSILACAILLRKKTSIRQIGISVIAFLVSEAVLFLAICIGYPREFQEMRNAAEYQATLLSSGSSIQIVTLFNNLINYLTRSCVAIPFLLIGLISSVQLLKIYLKRREINKTITLIIAWILPTDIILLSNTYFLYHYFTLIPICIVAAFLYVDENSSGRWTVIASFLFACLGAGVCWLIKKEDMQPAFLNYSTVMLVLLHLVIFAVLLSQNVSRTVSTGCQLLVLTVAGFFYVNYSSVIAPKYWNLIQMTKSSAEVMAQALPDDLGSEPVLLLDSGTVTFYHEAPSFSEYYYNLPLQRWSPGKNWDVQVREYERVLSYTGKYIVSMSWFDLEKYPELKAKIENEYVRLENSGYWVYSASWDVFSLDTAPDRESMAGSPSDCVYVRRE